MEINLNIPIKEFSALEFSLGDQLFLSGFIFTGRDAVLPKIAHLCRHNRLHEIGISLAGSGIFHTAVSDAGVGPTSSNKYDIESNIPILSKAGVKFHIGKGELSRETINELKKHNSIYAIVPPVTALLGSKIQSKKLIAFPEEGMEAFHQLEVIDFPVIIAAINGKSIYDEG